MVKPFTKIAISIVFAYFVFGLSFLSISDRIMAGMNLNASILPPLLVKEWVFVGISSVGLYWLLRLGYRRLAENERRWTMALDGAGHGVWDWNAVTNQVFYSQGWKRLLGYSCDEVGSTLGEWEKRVHPDDLATCYAELERHFGGETPVYRSEHRMLCKDGTYRWIRDQGMVFEWTEAGRPLRVVGTHTDITSQKVAEQGLKESEKRFRDLVETTSDWVWEVDAEGRYTYASPRCKDLLGYEPKEVIGKTPLDLMPPEEATIVAEAFQIKVAARDPIDKLENCNWHKDGHKVILETSGVPIFDAEGGLLGYRGIDRDITDRKRSEDILRVSEEKYRLLVENQTDLVVKVDPDGRFEFVSPSYCRLFDKTEAELLGKRFMPLVHEDDRDLTAKAMEDLFRPPYKAYLEQRAMTRDGWRWLGWMDTSIRDDTGNITAIIGVGRDITDRREAEFELALHSAAIRESLNGFDILNTDGEIVYANQAYLRMWGFDTMGEVVGTSQAAHCADPQVLERIIRELEDCGRDVREFTGRRKDGSLFDCLMANQKFVAPDRETLYLGTSLDVTERKQAERALIEKEARYRQVVEHMSDGVAVYETVDDGANFMFVEHNPAGERISGLSRDEVIGKNVTQVFPGVVSIGLLDTFRRVWRSGQPESHPGSEYQDNGVMLWFENHVFKLPSGQVVAVYADVTERKRASEELEKRVSERTAELTAANQELESFTYSVSHDLRAPLRAIRGFSQALLEDYGAELSTGAKDYLCEIETGGARMGNLIDGLLTLSRSTRGGVAREPVNISDIAAEALRRLVQLETGRKVALHVEAGLNASADPRLVKTLLNNLLENAWKYTRGKESAEISVFGEDRNNEMVFCVQDNGAGFDQAFVEKLFEPFQRLHRQDEFPGIGIGLATVQRIVRRHGGWINGNGVPGEGAVFRFTLAERRDAP